MKIRFLSVDTSHIPDPAPTPLVLHVPTLDAYAIAYGSLSINGMANQLDDKDIQIVGSDLSLTNFNITSTDRCVLEIYYYGIKEYDLLFPKVKASDPARAIRLGMFYQEAETCFEGGAWMSFMLMSGAIFEHLLFHKLGYPSNNNFSNLSSTAKQNGLITDEEFNTIEMAREFRNRIHCNKMHLDYVSRGQAMAARSLTEILLLKL